MFLEATYTPTPLYVNTPHPATEAYLLSNEPENALYAYEKAIEQNQNFAPAYLGRARALSSIDPEFDLEKDLSIAIGLDPNLEAAHLDLIAFYLSIGDYDQASNLLDSVDEITPDSPLIHAYRSQVLMNSGDYEGAIEAAEKAYELDQTILDIYKILGELNVYSGNAEQASHFMEIYLRYIKDDPYTWAIYGQALFNEGERLDQAMQAFNLALELDENSLTALLFRGYAYLELGEGQLAVNDLFIARNFDRESFRASMGLAKALALTERYNDAISQFTGSEQLVETVLQQAEVYYWRAKTFDMVNDFRSADQEFSALLELESEEIPVEWIDEAQRYLLELTPTPTMTSSPVPATKTPTLIKSTSTQTSTPQPTKTTPSPTPTPKPTNISRPRE
jgi:tetratricopeptide (TPR) repeat protein